MEPIDFKRKIKEYRDLHFLTQTEFAKELGVTSVTISRWETGKCSPNISQKKKLYEVFLSAGIVKERKNVVK